MRNTSFCMPVLLLLFALSGVGVSIHIPSSVAAPTVISTISVGINPYGVGVNSSTNRIYVANVSSNTVSVIDGADNTVLSTISVGNGPYGVGVNASTNRIYVTNGYGGTVSVIDGADNTVLSTISVGSNPYHVGVNSSTNRIYVANAADGTVSVIDGATNTVISTISVGYNPFGVGVNASTNRIYVANQSSNTVSVIDGATNTVLSNISVGISPNGVGVNSSTNRIYVANANSNTVSVIDGVANTILSTISVGSSPRGVGVNSSTNHIYVVNVNNSTVSVIDGATNTILSTISVGSYPFGVGVNASANRIYVSNFFGNTISVIDDSPSSPPTVTTGSATNVTSNSATLNGTVNANGASTTAWFQYGTTSGSYGSTSATQTVSGSSDTSISISVSGLSSSTTYYYRIAAQNSAGTSYGSESIFTTLAPPNTAPVANAGVDQTAYVGNVVTLDGSGSTDVDGNLLTYSWSFNSKPTDSTATLSDTTAVKPNFTVDKAGTYEVSLIVNDGMVDSAADTVTISTLNSAPVADAGTDQTPYVNDTVTLDGSSSYDVDGNLLMYSWAFNSKPADSTTTLSDVAAVNPTFTVDKAGTYVVSLIVNDGTVDSATDTVTISTLNSAPVANAGTDQTPYVNDTVTLNGSGSYDVDGNLLTYSWAFTTVPQGSNAALSDTAAVTPSFTVDKAGTYVVSLIVNDGTVNSTADTVTISTLNSAPVADAGADQTPYVNDTVTLDGSSSYDVDGNLLMYSWAFTTVPQGSNAALSDAAEVNPTFMVDKAGTYVVSLIVNDGTVNSAADTVTISTLNSAPVANAGLDQSVYVGNTVTLDGSGSSDVDGNALSYSWSFTSRPSGSTAALNDTTSANPTFTVDKAGTYVASLIVNDGTVNSAPDTIIISTINVAPVADAGVDQSVNVNDTVTLNGSGSSDADGDTITYGWSFTTKPSGSTAVLSGATSANPTFTADKVGTYVVSLMVNDGTVNSSPDTVTITANAVTINVEVSIKPETINLKSKGKFKAFIELPESYSADGVVLATVVCEGVQAIDGRVDDEGRYIATFNVRDLHITVSSKKEEVTLTVSGELEDGTKFTGSDTIRVKSREEKEKGKEKDK
ncbi:MAG: hypothetical protein FJ266_09555 [Planctomycetes bacterium]|nr:hypothetical protein [Planctomycetota bacterium]